MSRVMIEADVAIQMLRAVSNAESNVTSWEMSTRAMRNAVDSQIRTIEVMKKTELPTVTIGSTSLPQVNAGLVLNKD